MTFFQNVRHHHDWFFKYVSLLETVSSPIIASRAPLPTEPFSGEVNDSTPQGSCLPSRPSLSLWSFLWWKRLWDSSPCESGPGDLTSVSLCEKSAPSPGNNSSERDPASLLQAARDFSPALGLQAHPHRWVPLFPLRHLFKGPTHSSVTSLQAPHFY